MRRSELWTAAGGAHYAGKPRPVLTAQDDRFDATDSITIYVAAVSSAVEVCQGELVVSRCVRGRFRDDERAGLVDG